jgi:excisionase family DNA binding protein
MKTLTVGEVAARLGVSPSTVRMWGSRYGLIASIRSAGGHRRYTATDLARLQQMHAAVLQGTDPAAAAADVMGTVAQPRLRGARGGPGGSGLAVPGASREVRGLARAASRLDAATIENTVTAAVRRDGTVPAWDGLVMPVLEAAGKLWESTGAGIEIEHLLSQAVITAFDRHPAATPGLSAERPVLLASGPGEDHVLPLHAVRSALAERGVPARLFGARMPIPVLAAAARRTRAAAVLCWASHHDRAAAGELGVAVAAHRTIRVFVAGPGWDDVTVPGVIACTTLAQAVESLTGCWTAGAASKA